MNRIAVSLCFIALLACRSQRQPGVEAGGHDLFRITFGVSDTSPADWSGSAEAPGGRIDSLAPWRFDKDDALNPAARSWHCSTRYAAVLDPKYWWLGALHTVPKDMTIPKPNLIPKWDLSGSASIVRSPGTHGARRLCVPAERNQGGTATDILGRTCLGRVGSRGPQPHSR